MKRTTEKAAKAESEDARRDQRPAESVDLSFEEIEKRVSAKTTVLAGILEPMEGSHWRHGGLND
jgi:hypothetical protein